MVRAGMRAQHSLERVEGPVDRDLALGVHGDLVAAFVKGRDERNELVDAVVGLPAMIALESDTFEGERRVPVRFGKRGSACVRRSIHPEFHALHPEARVSGVGRGALGAGLLGKQVDEGPHRARRVVDDALNLAYRVRFPGNRTGDTEGRVPSARVLGELPAEEQFHTAFRRRRHGFEHPTQRFGLVDHAVESPRIVPEKGGGAGRVGGVLVDAGGRVPRTVQVRDVHHLGQDQERPVGRQRVEFRETRRIEILDEHRVPAEGDDPVVGARCSHGPLQGRHHLGAGAVAKAAHVLGLAEHRRADGMAVGLDQAGQESAPLQVDDLCITCAREEFRLGPQRRDAPSLDGKRLRPRLRRIHGEDLSADEDAVERPGGRRPELADDPGGRDPPCPRPALDHENSRSPATLAPPGRRGAPAKGVAPRHIA